MLNCAGFTQPNDLVDFYRSSELFEDHRIEAFKVHNALIYGNMEDSTLMLFVLDTSRLINSRFANIDDIKKAISNLDFQHHSARIDTLVRVEEFRTSVTFRDISYLGKNMFMAYRTYIEFYWDENLRTVRRVISFTSGKVASRSIWNRGDWIDYSKSKNN